MTTYARPSIDSAGPADPEILGTLIVLRLPVRVPILRHLGYLANTPGAIGVPRPGRERLELMGLVS